MEPGLQTATTLRDRMAMSGQSLLAASGQILVAAQSRRSVMLTGAFW